jgi:hypothetical protein
MFKNPFRDLSLLRYFVLSLHGEQIVYVYLHLESGYVTLSLLMCLLRGLATDTSTTKGAHNLIQMYAAT